MRPLLLPPNQLHRFYRGGRRIAELRGVAGAGDRAPEEWLASTVPVYGSDSIGLAHLPDGRVLRDALAADAEGWLGPDHVGRLGSDPAVLVKLLDAGERLPVHCHPDRAFARERLGLPYGKTEAWVIVSAEGGEAKAAVHVGFREEVDAATLAGWVERQDAAGALEAMNRLEVAAGDVVFVPGGVPHTIGEGILLVELQEPSDLSILLEWEGFEIDGAREGHLGLGFAVALEAVDRAPLAPERLRRLTSRREASGAPGVEMLFPAEADGFFRAQRVKPEPEASLAAAFSILLVLAGGGRLETEHGGGLALSPGTAVVVPYAAGENRLEGDLEAIRCLSPDLDAS